MSSVSNYKVLECEDYEGFFMPKCFGRIKERIESLECRNEDIWVTSYPKTGSNWVQEMVWLIANNLNYEKAKLNLYVRCMYVEGDGLGTYWSKFSKDNGLMVEDKFDRMEPYDILTAINSTAERRFLKTHIPWHLMPKEIKDGIKTPKIIHVMRNPKQVVPSFYYHSLYLFPTYIGDLDNFVNLFMEGTMMCGGYFNTVLSYWKQRHRPNLLILTYEDMKRDLKGTIRKVSKFLDTTYSETEIDKLAKHLSFGEMKNNTAVNMQPLFQDPNIHFMRKGSADSYKEELSQDNIRKLDEWIDKNAKGTDLPYERKYVYNMESVK